MKHAGERAITKDELADYSTSEDDQAFKPKIKRRVKVKLEEEAMVVLKWMMALV